MPRPTDMADRQPSPEELRLLDLLYGELEGEEEAAALREVEADAERAGEMAAFSRVRSLLRDLPEEEPPAAISAQLLHAAAKAAPAPRPADERPGLWAKLKGWFSPVLMHPAISAAAMFVVVVGVAGALYMTGNFDKAEPRTRSGATPPAAERDDRGRFQDEAPPAGAAQMAPGRLDLPTTPSGDDIAIDGKDVAGEPASGDGEATEKQTKPARRGAAGTKGGLIVADPKPKDPAKNDKKFELDNNAPAPVAEPPADPAPVTTGSSGDRDMIETEEKPAEQTRAPAPTKKPMPQKPAPQPSTPPPAPPPPQSQPPPDDARTNYNRAVELHKRALQAARDGECDAIADIGKTVRNLDLNYYNTKYRNDSRLTGCQKPPAPKSPVNNR